MGTVWERVGTMQKCVGTSAASEPELAGAQLHHFELEAFRAPALRLRAPALFLKEGAVRSGTCIDRFVTREVLFLAMIK